MINFISEYTQRAYEAASDTQPWKDHFKLRAQEMEVFLARFKLGELNRILEIGCGNAFSSCLLSKFTHEIIATDLEKFDYKTHSIGFKKAQKLLANLKIDNSRLVACSSLDLPFPDDYFDMVFSGFVLEHLSDKDRAISEISRVLKKDGILVSFVPNFIERIYNLPSIYLYFFKKAIFYLSKSISSRLYDKDNRGNASKSLDSLGSTVISWKKFRQNYPHFPLPEPHGFYPNCFREFYAYFPRNWKKLFRGNGMEVIAFFPIFSGRFFFLNRFHLSLLTYFGKSLSIVTKKIV